MKKVKLLNTYVNNMKTEEVLKQIEYSILEDRYSYIVPVNVDVIMQIESDLYLKQIVDQADIVLVDGTPLIWIAALYKKPITYKISGSDLVPLICKLAATKGYKIFLLGGKDGVGRKAKENLEREYHEIKIVGTYAPPFGFENDQNEIDKINRLISQSMANIVIVCFGCPKQERFIYENHLIYCANVSICAGATIDFLAGKVNRAPRWMSEYGFEWFYRFLQEPKRLFKRYFINDIKIFKLIWKYK